MMKMFSHNRTNQQQVSAITGSRLILLRPEK